MLKKMRLRFVAAAMAAMIAVVLILLCIINIWNYTIVADQQDRMLSLIANSAQAKTPSFGNGDFKPSGKSGGFSIEQQYMMRFFSVSVDQNGSITAVNTNRIASISTDDATKYALSALKSNHTSGYYKDYRYLKTNTEQGITITFLNSERELVAVRNLLVVSGAVALASLFATFVLVLLFSSRAIAPYVRNIQTQKRFITDAGHELKTPLTAISTSADILAIELPENEWVRNIQQQSSRLSKLIANLITLSRLDEDKPFPEKITFSLSEAVWEISEPMQSIAAASGKQYACDIENDLYYCGDRNSIQQAISILLDNAIRYSNDSGNIYLRLRRRQRKIEILVSNTCKLNKEIDLHRIFDRFYRPDESRSKDLGGTGVGLSIAKATVESHGGKIFAKRVGDSENTIIQFSILL